MSKKKYHSLPKRIAGVKIPKGLRRYADTPLGGALIGVTLVELGREAVLSPQMSGYLAELRHNIGKAGVAIAGTLQHAGSIEASGRRSRKRSARLEQEELAN